jgi:hypothetical protein
MLHQKTAIAVVIKHGGATWKHEPLPQHRILVSLTEGCNRC